MDSNGNTITAWQISWGDGDQAQSISSAPASVTHVYTAVGNYAISATATVSDGNGGTYTAVTGGPHLDSSFGTGGVAKVTPTPLGYPFVALDPNGDLAVILDSSGQLALYKANGQPDSQFAAVSTGLEVASGQEAGDVGSIEVAVQPDGKVLVAGDLTVTDHGYYGYLDEIAVKRYNADGTPDTTFGSGGTATISVLGQDGELDGLESLLLESDGSIAVAATVWLPGDSLQTQNGSTCVAVASLNANGTPNQDFNGGTPVTTLANGCASAAALTPGGKIVVAGCDEYGNVALARFNTDGTPDTSLNGTGTVSTSISGEVSGVVVQASNKIVVSGTWDSGHFDLARFNSDGSLDDTFGPNGTGEVSTSFTSEGFQCGVCRRPGGRSPTARSWSTEPCSTKPCPATNSLWRTIPATATRTPTSARPAAGRLPPIAAAGQAAW